MAFLHSERPATTSNRTLTFQERVWYQRAIEEVYWRHRMALSTITLDRAWPPLLRTQTRLQPLRSIPALPER
jgi:hypothetical protein